MSRALIQQRAFVLLEVLVALLVISIGMLGIAGLLVGNLQMARTAVWQQSAVLLSQDIAARIRSNPAAGDAYGLPGAGRSCGSLQADCAARQRAAQDLATWQQRLAEHLPGSELRITVHPHENPLTYDVRLRWQAPQLAVPSELHSRVAVYRPATRQVPARRP